MYACKFKGEKLGYEKKGPWGTPVVTDVGVGHKILSYIN